MPSRLPVLTLRRLLLPERREPFSGEPRRSHFPGLAADVIFAAGLARRPAGGSGPAMTNTTVAGWIGECGPSPHDASASFRFLTGRADRPSAAAALRHRPVLLLGERHPGLRHAHSSA